MRLFTVVALLCLPGLAGAIDAPSSGSYRGLVKELVKDCEAGKKIAVANFSYPDGRAAGDGDVVSERITTEVVKLKKFRVAERKEIEKVFQELKLQSSGAMGADSIKDMGKVLGADLMIVGTLTELPKSRIEINARLVGVESGEIINAAEAKVKKDWKDKPPAEETGDHEFKKTTELDEYGKAIKKYIDKKADEDKHTIKEPPPSFE